MNDVTKAADGEMLSEVSVSWHAISSEDVLKKLETPLQSGLSSEQVEARRAIYGLNQLTEAPHSTFLKMVLDQLNNFVVILLIVASITSAVLGDTIEAAAIMAIVVLNAILGVVQERRAEEALAALKKLAAPEAQVLRDGRRVLADQPQDVINWKSP